MNKATQHQSTRMPISRIIRTWWPLAASWLLMGAEVPIISAIVARLASPEINLAAYGGIVSPLSLIIESPIMMLLAASTALSKDWASYQKVRGYMMSAGAVLTGLHALLVFTPLYKIIVVGFLSPPAEIVGPARLGLALLLPWTWSIAYRRFNQGVLIRFGHSQAVGIGTVIRLSADLLVLLVGYSIHSLPGIAVAACAMSAGVLSEAVYAGIVVRPVLRDELKLAPQVQPALSYRMFFAFYLPLAMTSLLSLAVNPIGSAAISRMPNALASLAAWPVVSGLAFMVRSLGVAFNEVVVALLDEDGSSPGLRRFAFGLAGFTVLVLVVVAATPLSRFWFVGVSALPPELARLAQTALWIALPMPGLSVYQSLFQGAILHSKVTRGITEAVVVFLICTAICLGAGMAWGKVSGLYITLGSFTISSLVQTIWLWQRSRKVLRSVQLRDESIQLAEALPVIVE
jgi:hypothetical protein